MENSPTFDILIQDGVYRDIEKFVKHPIVQLFVHEKSETLLDKILHSR